MEEQERNALELLKDNEFERAAQLYLKLAMASPEQERFLISAANCYDRFGDKKLALSLYKKALAANAQSIPALLNASTIYYEIKKYEKSVAYAHSALELSPDNFAVLTNLANAHYALGKYDEALAFYEKMYALNPQSYLAILGIADTCYHLGLYVRSIEYAEMAQAKRPNSANPYIIAGNSYTELSQNEKAMQYLKRALELEPTSTWLYSSVSNLFRKTSNWKQCLHYAWKAICFKEGSVSVDDHINFAYLLYEAQDEGADAEIVEKYLKDWEQRFGDNAIVHHACCALENRQEISAMDLSYVKGLFDGFASSFDDILKELEYQVPTLIADQLKDNLKVKLFKKRRILDLGCGTGLCTEALRTYFPNEEFYGVDISDKMIYMAGKKNIFTKLYVDDILNFMENTDVLYHAVVAGDVLTYIGDLKPLFRLLTKVIKFGGFFACSISKNTFNSDNYFLSPSGRFVHTISYIQRLLKYCGFKTISVQEHVLRHEGAREVIGYIILAQKEIEVVFE